ncbi:MAG: class I SAM-dependent methyltransferase [Planctomycetota bacterium]|jgi:predicted nicotinamide N-methyase
MLRHRQTVPPDASEIDLTSLPQIPGGWKVSSVDVAQRTLRLVLPACPDAFLDDPQVQQANRESDYMPYWAYLWPAARQMAQLVLNADWPTGASALELGSGIGLVGIAGLLGGLQVTFSDYDATSLEAAVLNSNLNDVTPAGRLVLDWRTPQSYQGLRRFPVVLGCDVLYEVGLHSFVLDVLDQLLDDDGLCWLGDPGRNVLPQFCRRATERGYSVELRDADGQTPVGTATSPARFLLVILRRRN